MASPVWALSIRENSARLQNWKSLICLENDLRRPCRKYHNFETLDSAFSREAELGIECVLAAHLIRRVMDHCYCNGAGLESPTSFRMGVAIVVSRSHSRKKRFEQYVAYSSSNSTASTLISRKELRIFVLASDIGGKIIACSCDNDRGPVANSSSETPGQCAATTYH
jgi:hypothetical protein